MQNYIDKQIDRYRITERLGMGGMAVVYKAFDTRLERDVALKLIRTDEIPQSQYEKLMKRFEREAKAQARFDHKHIVTVHDYGEVDGAPYLVMNYVSGSTLKAHIGKPVDWQQAVRWLLPLTDALAYAHKRGVVHRDIKPSNILFDEEGQPVLTDFGIAKILETDDVTLTGTGLGVGTPEYMAPEQWQGQATPATDQYALGVVLYELLTGQKPYTADTPVAVALLQMSEPLRSPRELAPGIPEGLEKLLYKAMARDPQDRFDDMDAFRVALEGQLIDQPVQVQDADPISVPEPRPVAAEPSPQPRSEAETVDELAQTPVEKVPEHIEAPQEKPHKSQKPVQGSKNQVRGKSALPGWTLWAGAGVLVVALLAVAILIGGVSLLTSGRRGSIQAEEPTEAAVAQVDTPIQTATDKPAPTAMETPLFTATATITSTATPNPTITLTSEPTLGIGSTMVNPVDGAVLVYVPEGEFLMGSDDGLHFGVEPKRSIYIDAFWIYQHPVTNAEYRLCVDEGSCNLPNHRLFYFDNSYKNHPVVYVSWFDAAAYCEWTGGRLPTEAEWEKAARGTDGRVFPWGNNNPTCEIVKYHGCKLENPPVGSYSGGVSPFGVLDMAGNVREWVADWLLWDYYHSSPDQNPTGPSNGIWRVIRGSTSGSIVRSMHIYSRNGYDPNRWSYSIGFRCVHSLDF